MNTSKRTDHLKGRQGNGEEETRKEVDVLLRRNGREGSQWRRST